MHAWGYVKNRKKRLIVAWVSIVNSLGIGFKNTQTHRERAVVSSTKARIIFTNRTKKANPIKPKSANSTHPDE
jgi:hypothetical protein